LVFDAWYLEFKKWSAIMSSHILLVDDEISIRQSLSGILEDEGYQTSSAEDGHKALAMLEVESFDIVLLDIWMPGIDGIEVLKRIKQSNPQLPVIMISGHGNVETAVKATRLGAIDFIEKPLDLQKILLSIENALKLSKLEQENRMLKERQYARVELTGNSAAIMKINEQIARVAPTNAWVLITGENGTGKELAAKSLHIKSKRGNATFVDVNCAAIPAELIESELFGHEKGAFTGAITQKRGKFDMANNGTLFLDEIADMSLATQAKILRILQEQRFERLGGNKTINVDVRVLAATNKDLEQEISEGRFRKDLFYRLNVIPINVPPLRERTEDIPSLIEDFLNEFAKKGGMKRKVIEPDAVELLKHHIWPGNVRELKNYIERLVIMTIKNIITVDDIELNTNIKTDADEKGLININDWKKAKTSFEKSYLQKWLDICNGNISKTSELIGIERSNLHKKLKTYGLVD